MTGTTNQLIKDNIKALLKLRHKEPEDLAKFLRNTKDWIQKVFREDRRQFPLKYFVPISKFLGVEVYALLQPGIVDYSERRNSLGDRRKWRDRRVSPTVLSEKPLDIDLIHVVRALSPEGRKKAIASLMDILNDELEPLRTTAHAPVAQDRSGETPTARRVRRKK